LTAILDFRHEVTSVMIARHLDVLYVVINHCVVFEISQMTYVSVKPRKLLLFPVIWLQSLAQIDIPGYRKYHYYNS